MIGFKRYLLISLDAVLLGLTFAIWIEDLAAGLFIAILVLVLDSFLERYCGAKREGNK